MHQLQLAIPEPCRQDWNQMSTNEQGRFCNSCAKSVVDFTTMTDGQLLNYFLTLKEEHICGRIADDQLERTIQSMPAPRKKIFRYWHYIMTLFLMAGKSEQTKAQGGIIARVTASPSNTPEKVTTAEAVKQVRITGLNGEPLQWATVSFSTGDHTFITDSTGIIFLDQEDQDKTMIISAIGFDEKKVLVKDIRYGTVRMDQNIKSLDEVKVTAFSTTGALKISMGGMMSSFAIEHIHYDTMTRIANFVSPSVNVYPNPAIRGSSVNLSVKLKKPGAYHLYILDAAGKLTMSQNYVAGDKKTVQQFIIPSSWSKGIYFVMIVDEDGKTIGKEKIVLL